MRIRVLSAVIAAIAFHPGTTVTAEGKSQSRVEPRSGLELVHLDPVEILFGCEPRDHECFADEKPAHRVAVDGFWVGRTEVTVEAYDRCVRAGACSKVVPAVPADVAEWASSCNEGMAGREKHPINCVDWAQARQFCAWMGGRLPTESEWERTAKGGDGRIYPWGDTRVSIDRGNFCDRTCHLAHPAFQARGDASDGWAETAPVGSFPKGASREGVLDLAGNVWEWTGTQHDTGDIEIRGGGWTVDESRWFRSSNRSWSSATRRAIDLGFRCVVGDHG